jgi:hypothetical protein
MTPATIDRAELEDRVRAALADRARSTVVDVPDDFTPGAFVPPAAHRPRRAVLVAAAALALVVLGIAALAVRNDDGIDSATTEPPEGWAPGTPVEGPTGSAWFVFNLPDWRYMGSDSEPTEALPGGRPELRAFRTDAGFDGPSLWLEQGGGTLEGHGVTDVTVRGESADADEDGDVVTLVTPGDDGFLVVAAHLALEDVVAFVDGLAPRDGGGWDATVLPRGLVEVTEEDPPLPAAERSEMSYTGTDGDTYELFVDPGGQAVFEERAREQVSDGGEVEALSVDGRPGVLVDTGDGEAIAVWRPTDDAVADFRTSVDREGLLAAMEALRPVDEADWPGGTRPE